VKKEAESREEVAKVKSEPGTEEEVDAPGSPDVPMVKAEPSDGVSLVVASTTTGEQNENIPIDPAIKEIATALARNTSPASGNVTALETAAGVTSVKGSKKRSLPDSDAESQEMERTQSIPYTRPPQQVSSPPTLIASQPALTRHSPTTSSPISPNFTFPKTPQGMHTTLNTLKSMPMAQQSQPQVQTKSQRAQTPTPVFSSPIFSFSSGQTTPNSSANNSPYGGPDLTPSYTAVSPLTTVSNGLYNLGMGMPTPTPHRGSGGGNKKYKVSHHQTSGYNSSPIPINFNQPQPQYGGTQYTQQQARPPRVNDQFNRGNTTSPLPSPMPSVPSSPLPLAVPVNLPHVQQLPALNGMSSMSAVGSGGFGGFENAMGGGMSGMGGGQVEGGVYGGFEGFGWGAGFR
jgi:hypothetical protein